MKNSTDNTTQEAKILDLLKQARGEWVGLPAILGLGIAQHSARLWALRHLHGLQIENKTKRVNGVRQSWYRLLSPKVPAPPASQPPQPTGSLFNAPLVAFRGGE